MTADRHTPTADRHTPRQEMHVMARAFARAMGHDFYDRPLEAPTGAWFIERADTQRPLYRLAERLPGGALSHPVSSAALTSQGLADALYFARIAVGMDRSGAPARDLGYPYRGTEV